MEIIVVVLYGNIIAVVPGEGVTTINATVATYYRGEPNIVIQELADDGITDITLIEEFLMNYGMTLYRNNFIVIIDKDSKTMSTIENKLNAVFIENKFETVTFDSKSEIYDFLKG